MFVPGIRCSSGLQDGPNRRLMGLAGRASTTGEVEGLGGLRFSARGRRVRLLTCSSSHDCAENCPLCLGPLACAHSAAAKAAPHPVLLEMERVTWGPSARPIATCRKTPAGVAGLGMARAAAFRASPRLHLQASSVRAAAPAARSSSDERERSRGSSLGSVRARQRAHVTRAPARAASGIARRQPSQLKRGYPLNTAWCFRGRGTGADGLSPIGLDFAGRGPAAVLDFGPQGSRGRVSGFFPPRPATLHERAETLLPLL